MSGGAGAVTLAEALSAAAGSRILVASDFDGTLAPLVADPGDARPHPGARGSLVALARLPDVTVAVVSGRGRDDLVHLLGAAPGVQLIGEHGSDDGSNGTVSDPRIAELAQQLNEIAEDLPGSLVEVKRFSVAFHYRQSTGDVDGALERLRQGPARMHGVLVTEGKKVFELHVTVRNKGDAVSELKSATGAEVVIFIGDDSTDESVFERLDARDIGIKVGKGVTAAEFRVTDIDAVAEVLEDFVGVLS